MVGMNDMAKTYYPPRARWYSPAFYFCSWLRRRLHLAGIRLPSSASVRRVALGLVLPGFAFAASGQRPLARAIFGSYALAATVFILWLGYSISSLALGVMISLHVSSVLHLTGRQSLKLGFRWRVVLSLMTFSVVYLAIYYPLQRQFEKRVAMPMRVGNKVVMVRTRQSAASVKRGDWVAYRIEPRSVDHFYLAGGLGFGRVQAVAGDRIVFTPQTAQVNGVEFPRRSYMPGDETWVVPEKHWFIWPESAISISGNPQNDAITRLMRESALVGESEFVGRPLRRWFWRRQTLP